MTVASQDVQNPAYRPTPPLHASSPPSRLRPRRWRCVVCASGERRFITERPERPI